MKVRSTNSLDYVADVLVTAVKWFNVYAPIFERKKGLKLDQKFLI
jgi:hypothetical protein